MILEKSAAGQGMKRAVVSGERRGWGGISTGGEKLVYKQKLRKYITNCNGESEPLAAWSTLGESGLFNHPRESNPRHLLCYIVTRKLRFYKWSRGEIEPATSVPFTLPCYKLRRYNWTDYFEKKVINISLNKRDRIFATQYWKTLKYLHYFHEIPSLRYKLDDII